MSALVFRLTSRYPLQWMPGAGAAIQVPVCCVSWRMTLAVAVTVQRRLLLQYLQVPEQVPEQVLEEVSEQISGQVSSAVV